MASIPSASVSSDSAEQPSPALRPVSSPGASVRVLALGTSTDWCSVALLMDSGVRAELPEGAGSGTGERAAHRPPEAGAQTVTEASERCGNDHSRRLLPMARQLLADAGLGWGDLDLIAFDAGPGSFTGLRIGCGVAQGLAFAHGLPVVAVPSLHALALQAGSPVSIVVMDARMREVYAAPFSLVDGWPVALEPIRALSVDDAPAILAGWAGKYRQAQAGAVVPRAIGDAFARHPGLSPALLAEGLDVDGQAFPDAVAVARIAVHRHRAGLSLDAADAAPLYVRDKVALDVDEQRRARLARTGASTP